MLLFYREPLNTRHFYYLFQYFKADYYLHKSSPYTLIHYLTMYYTYPNTIYTIYTYTIYAYIIIY